MPKLEEVVFQLRHGANPEYRKALGEDRLIFHNKQLSEIVTGEFSAAKLQEIADTTRDARYINTVKKHGRTFVLASEFKSSDRNFDTHYDSVWVRDSVWTFLALKLQDPDAAKQTILALLDYIAMQFPHAEKVIRDPSLIEGDKGAMNAIHVRFKARTMQDVRENGRPQLWNHKQNDALGLLLDASIDSLREGLITLQDLVDGSRAKSIIVLTDYLIKTKFYEQEDAGAWEEAPRRNTSSIALCTSALENLEAYINQNITFHAYATKTGLFTDRELASAIKKGYQVIKKQIRLGGESPNYPEGDWRHRTADAALLTVIYPAKLKRLKTAYKKRIFDIIKPLIRSHGIVRYIGDTYQSANFWFNNLPTDLSEDIFERRQEVFIEGTEAQWFFDSWAAAAALRIYQDAKDHRYFAMALDHFNRGLAQATDQGYFAANGRVIDKIEFPESYNFIIKDSYKHLVPSAVTPLNWAKACQTLALHEFATTFNLKINL